MQAVNSRKDYLIPFHLPACNVVAAHLSLGKLVGNHHKMMDEFDWDTPPSCTCQAFKERHPEAQMVKHPNDDSQHVATRLCSLNFSDRLKYIIGVSAKTQVCPKFRDYWGSHVHSSPNRHKDIMWVVCNLRIGNNSSLNKSNQGGGRGKAGSPLGELLADS